MTATIEQLKHSYAVGRHPCSIIAYSETHIPAQEIVKRLGWGPEIAFVPIDLRDMHIFHQGNVRDHVQCRELPSNTIFLILARHPDDVCLRIQATSAWIEFKEDRKCVEKSCSLE